MNFFDRIFFFCIRLSIAGFIGLAGMFVGIFFTFVLLALLHPFDLDFSPFAHIAGYVLEFGFGIFFLYLGLDITQKPFDALMKFLGR